MKIGIFAGPTGGHVYPAVAFAESLRKRHPGSEIFFVTGERARPLVTPIRRELAVQFEFIPDFPFPRPNGLKFLGRFFQFLLKLVHAFRKSERQIALFKPDLCIGFGSYVSFPGLVMSRVKGVPTFIHEQNRKIGQANAWLTAWVDRIALSFETGDPLTPVAKTVVTGLPLRASLVERAVKRGEPTLASSSGKVHVLLVGGSQGSQAINQLWEEMLRLLSDEEKSRLAVTHITGEGDLERFKKMYPAIGIEASVVAYHERMEELYSQADLAVTRAGASTLFELALFGLPAIVFPYPHAEGHQEMNARYFERESALVLLSEEKCSPEELRENVFALVHSPELRKKLSRNVRELARPRAADHLVDAVEELLSEKEIRLT